MIKLLRKRHLQVWSILLLAIPFGIICAWLSVRQVKADRLLQPEISKALPEIISSIEKDNYTVRLRRNGPSEIQLEWINKVILTVPTAVIYKINDGQAPIDSGELVGRIEARGSYYIPLKQVSTEKPKFILYDFIHKQIIDTINFQR